MGSDPTAGAVLCRSNPEAKSIFAVRTDRATSQKWMGGHLSRWWPGSSGKVTQFPTSAAVRILTKESESWGHRAGLTGPPGAARPGLGPTGTEAKRWISAAGLQRRGLQGCTAQM